MSLLFLGWIAFVIWLLFALVGICKQKSLPPADLEQLDDEIEWVSSMLNDAKTAGDGDGKAGPDEVADFEARLAYLKHKRERLIQ